jgi:hypothetical protein
MERKMKLRLLVLAGVVIALGIGVAVLYLLGYIGPKQSIATADQIQEEASLLEQSMGYRDGGQYLAEMKKPGVIFDPWNLEPDVYVSYCIGLHILVDFVATITPQQVDIMRDKGGLPYESLSPDQKRLLLLLHKYSAYKNFEEADISHSTFLFSRERKAGFIHMDWMVTKPNGTVSKGFYGLADDSERVATIAERARYAKPGSVKKIVRLTR